MSHDGTTFVYLVTVRRQLYRVVLDLDGTPDHPGPHPFPVGEGPTRQRALHNARRKLSELHMIVEPQEREP